VEERGSASEVCVLRVRKSHRSPSRPFPPFSRQISHVCRFERGGSPKKMTAQALVKTLRARVPQLQCVHHLLFLLTCICRRWKRNEAERHEDTEPCRCGHRALLAVVWQWFVSNGFV